MPKTPPAGYHTVTPSIVVRDARRAIDFYKRAFGAEAPERDIMTGPDGRVMHAEMTIGDSRLMLGEENPAWPAFKSAETLGGSPISLHLYVPDVDASFERAVTAGAKVEMPIAEMFWGDRYGKVRDPFGMVWGLATRTKELSADEIARAGREWMAKMAAQK
jgi:uncharacterized glyoxalase superfamily protein PhnB